MNADERGRKPSLGEKVEPDDGSMTIVEIDQEHKQALVRFTVRGHQAECWVPLAELIEVRDH